LQCFLSQLDLFPIAQYRSRRIPDRSIHIGPVAGRPRSLVAKDVRMAAWSITSLMVKWPSFAAISA
jgi:hypothetical protein